MTVPTSCFEHTRYVAGCRGCRDAAARYQRSRKDVLPSTPLRTEADDAYAAGLVELLAQREIDVGRAAIFCGLLLDEHAERPL